jgi:hypothetical protein
VKLVLLIPFIFITSLSFGQTYAKSDFIESTTPLLSDLEWKRLGQLNFFVSVVDGGIQIQKNIYTKTEHTFCEGKFIANPYEFNRGLYFKANDSSQKLFTINDKKVSIDTNSFISNRRREKVPNDFKDYLIIEKGYGISTFSYRDTLYYLKGGNQYVNPNMSSINSIIKTDTSFRINKIIDIEGNAIALTVHNDTILVVTYEGFYIINNWKKEEILKYQYNKWGSGYPTSVAMLDSKNVYIGYLGGYAKLNLEDKKLKFYKYNN